jgi:hypothetical protein
VFFAETPASWSAGLFVLGLALSGCTSSPTGFLPRDGSSDSTSVRDASDASASDAPDVAVDAPFFCGSQVCAPSGQYCVHLLGEGGVLADGAPNEVDQCLPIPEGCGANPTCVCIEANAPCEAGVEGEGCVQSSGVEVTCPSS